MTESTFSQLEDDIPSVAQLIEDQAPLHMILNEAKFAPDTWKGQPSTNSANTSRNIQYIEDLEDSRLPVVITDQLSRIFEENLTNKIDAMGLGSEYDTASRIISNKWEKVCSQVCRSMGATVDGSSDGESNQLAFFFKPESISLQTLPGSGLSFKGTFKGEACKVQGDVPMGGHLLQSVDWELLAPEDEVASYRSTEIS